MPRPALREPFDQDRSFVVARGLTVNGKPLAPKEPFDKAQVATRRLQLLYEQRFLDMAPEEDLVPGLDPDNMSDEQLRLFLEDNGEVVRAKASRAWLVRRVRQIVDAGAVAGAPSDGGDGARPSRPAPTESH